MLSASLGNALHYEYARMRLLNYMLYLYYRDPPPLGSAAWLHRQSLTRDVYVYKRAKYRQWASA